VAIDLLPGLLDGVVNRDNVEHVDDVADALLIEHGDFSPRHCNEIALRHHKSAAI
jgi:hypothetical protein